MSHPGGYSAPAAAWSWCMLFFFDLSTLLISSHLFVSPFDILLLLLRLFLSLAAAAAAAAAVAKVE